MENSENKNTNDKSVITSDEVKLSVNGNEEAIANQIERVKQLNKEQLEQAEAAKRLAEMQKKQQINNQNQNNQQNLNQYQNNQQLPRQQQEKNQPNVQNQLSQEQIRKQQEVIAQNELNRKMQEEEALKIKRQQQLAKEQEEKAKKELEAKKQQEIANNKKNNKTEKDPAGVKRVLAILLFIGLFAMIYFLPQISKFVEDYKASKMKEEVITTGVSTCVLEKSTKTLDTKITASFNIINSKLKKLTYTTVSVGDKSDDNELDKLNNSCMTLKEYAGELSGVTISCSTNNSKNRVTNTNKQILDYEKLDVKKVTHAYTEAGGIYPEFSKNEDIDKIEGKMNSAGYKCTRN